jgi:hypothetical protein
LNCFRVSEHEQHLKSRSAFESIDLTKIEEEKQLSCLYCLHLDFSQYWGVSIEGVNKDKVFEDFGDHQDPKEPEHKNGVA